MNHVMKKMLFTSLIFVLLSGFVLAQPQGAILKFDKLVHDYGTVYQGADGNCEFKFKNTGDEPLVLSNVRSTCGCTIPQWPKEPILPGQSAAIKVSYDTKRIGAINKQITVLSNATESSLTLSIKGTILQKPDEILPEKPVNNGFTPTAN
jgi:hypothetical protein